MTKNFGYIINAANVKGEAKIRGRPEMPGLCALYGRKSGLQSESGRLTQSMVTEARCYAISGDLKQKKSRHQ